MPFIMQTRHAAAALMLLGALLPGRSAAQATDDFAIKNTAEAAAIKDLVDSNLFARCAPMDLSVKELSEEESRALNLSEAAIVNAAESRLRAARVFGAKGDTIQFLSIHVGLLGRAFVVNTELVRGVPDLGFGRSGVVKVWDTGSFGTLGTDGGSAQLVLGVVSGHIDRFLTEYLRANEDDCALRRPGE